MDNTFVSYTSRWITTVWMGDDVRERPLGVDDAAYVKAGFLAAVAKGDTASPMIDRNHATQLLGTMLGGYNIKPLIELLDDDEVAAAASFIRQSWDNSSGLVNADQFARQR